MPMTSLITRKNNTNVFTKSDRSDHQKNAEIVPCPEYRMMKQQMEKENACPRRGKYLLRPTPLPRNSNDE